MDQERRTHRGASYEDLLHRVDELVRIGVELSRERDLTRLLETIVVAAKRLLKADGGTLYRVVNGRELEFRIVRTDSLGIAMGGSTGVPVPFEPIPLYDEQGRPNDHRVVAHAVLHGRTVNIRDAYAEDGFAFIGTRRFDRSTGYRSRSFLTVPMRSHEGEIIGVMQLLNALDEATGEIVTFSEADQHLAESLASQAAIAWTNRLLIDRLEELFESFINLINIAIDGKSPYTGGHCQRVPVLTMMLAEAAQRSERGALASFQPTDEELHELKLAGLLHDCGKVTTPVHVVDKATKLQALFDRIHLVDTRFEVLKRDAVIEALSARLGAQARETLAGPALADRLHALDMDREFVRECNVGAEFMTGEEKAGIERIAASEWVDEHGRRMPLLSEDERHNLLVERGTLTREDREVINGHVAMTLKMLEALPWPRHLRRVPEIAGSHHERLDGRGYPRGLSKDELSIPARIVCIADVFEALTARDRPYKHGKTLSESLAILGRMCLEGHVDPDLFDCFVREGIWRRYAERFLEPQQIDRVDLAAIPGFTP